MQVLQPFENELYELITYFLQRLTPPICFAAHNGNRFDYPIFLGELERINKVIDFVEKLIRKLFNSHTNLLLKSEINLCRKNLYIRVKFNMYFTSIKSSTKERL